MNQAQLRLLEKISQRSVAATAAMQEISNAYRNLEAIWKKNISIVVGFEGEVGMFCDMMKDVETAP